uniref:5-aminolevulinate synthase presequence domain-containing protein n=1 Tax=Sinocyclocheilus rhinocerous TaxID=307959 RepID=A0A673NE84_9TELE
MDAIFRCPFLSHVPQTFLQQARKSLVANTVKCPVMMDLASRPLVRSLCSTPSSFQKVRSMTPAGEGECLQPLPFLLEFSAFARLTEGLPAGHPVPPAGQAAVSKCPFLAAEMGQRNSSVVRQASMVLQNQNQNQNQKSFITNAACFPDVSPSELNPLVKDTKIGGNLMKKLMKQRPTRVSHLLQENMPKSMCVPLQ